MFVAEGKTCCVASLIISLITSETSLSSVLCLRRENREHVERDAFSRLCLLKEESRQLHSDDAPPVCIQFAQRHVCRKVIIVPEIHFLSAAALYVGITPEQRTAHKGNGGDKKKIF